MGFLFTSNKYIGLDIADRSIEVVHVSGKGNSCRVLKKARKKLVAKIVERGRIKNQEKLFDAVQDVLVEAGINKYNDKIFFGLPESQVFVHIFHTKYTKENLDNLVKDELANIVPIERDEMVFGYTTLREKTDGSLRVVAMATERTVIQEWKKFIEKLGFSNSVIVPETFASYLGLGIKNELHPVVIIDIGSATTIYSFYDTNGACFASSIDRAGEFATEKLATSLKLSSKDAEKIKQKEGLDNNDKKVVKVLTSFLTDIISDIKGSLDYCKAKNNGELKNFFLIGGTSQMPGLLKFFQKEFGKNVSLGVSKCLRGASDIYYIEAVGLTMYENKKNIFPIFDKGWIKEKKMPAKKVKKDEPKIFLENDEVEGKIKAQKMAFLAIIFIGVGLFVLAFWYRSQQEIEHQAQIAMQTKNFSYIHNIEINVPISTDIAEQTADRVEGRIVENKIQIIGEQNEAVETSRIAIAKQVFDQEILWKEFLDVTLATSTTGIEGEVMNIYTVKWLIYNEKKANSLFMSIADIEMKKIGVSYSISNIEKKSLEKSENDSVYLLKGAVSVATERQLE